MNVLPFVLTKTTFEITGIRQTAPDDSDDESGWPVFDKPIRPQRLFVDGVELGIQPSYLIRQYSHFFSWGHLGAGPSQTALAICLHIFRNQYAALALHQEFLRDFVAKWTPDGRSFTIYIDVVDFLIDYRQRLATV